MYSQDEAALDCILNGLRRHLSTDSDNDLFHTISDEDNSVHTQTW